ncbi:MAG: hypothetical protein GY769_04350 [bacterium]|nr:hypothetical protein [bacterium]
MKRHVDREGKFYSIDGEIVRPRDFVGVGGFKFVNHVVAWVQGGHGGEGGGVHLDRAERYIERDVLGLGCRRMRSPVELMFWGGPYFDLPTDGSVPAPYNRPNVANTLSLVNLRCGTGGGFSMTPKLEKVIRKLILLARKHDIIIEVPWLWTIKGEAGRKTKHHPDPRLRHGVSAWNEHYLAAQGIGAYLQKLYTQGDGEGETRVDPGGLNLISDACNEYTAHADVFTRSQLLNIAARWQVRDAPSQPINLISQSGVLDRYDPPLESDEGARGYDGPCTHPPRSRSRDKHGREYDWDETGDAMRNEWPDELLDANESQLLMTKAQRDFWVPLIPKWAGLGSTDMRKCRAMHECFLRNDIYTTLHTFRGMDGGWPETAQTVVEDTVREITGGGGPPPPPPPPPFEARPYDRFVVDAYRRYLKREPDKGGRAFYNGALENHYFELGGTGPSMTVAQMEERMLDSDEHRKIWPLP